ncbi:hypothetical protein [Paenibacillus harenae]|uniref:hypothetical protein n=1 Tax=Paenibacillus harenae TaxID=306543 RepID=UPI00042A9328|nr:hypothetical protein [Paenibacillus harenae]
MYQITKLVTVPVFLCFVLGCSSATIKNVNIEPPTRGLLAALQQEPVSVQDERGYQVTVMNDRPLQAGDADVQLRVTNTGGEPVLKFREDMTKLMHVIIVSSDLSSFQHVHPEYVGDGEFRARAAFPYGGRFLLTAEFKPDKQDVTTVRQWITVSGDAHPDEEVKPDHSFVKTAGSLRIKLSASPSVNEIKAGQTVMLLFRLADGETGQPVKEVEPFLGTSGHCVIMNSGADLYVHAHAVEGMSGGANIMFHTVFPEEGIYKLWGQFRYGGETVTVPYTLKVS